MKWLLLVLLISPHVFADGHVVTLQDLKTLSDSGRDQEVLRTAEKVKPAERGADWEAIVLKASKNFLAKVNDEDPTATFEVGKMLADENPHLLSDSDFAYAIGFAGVRGYSSKAIATPYFAKALKKDDARCKVTEVKDAVVDAFTRPEFEKSKVAASEIAFKLCPAMMDEDMVQRSTENDIGLKAACPSLMKAGKLQGVKLVKCKKAST